MTQHRTKACAVDNVMPPCQAACPLHQGVRDYLLAIATGNFDQAIEIIKETNPLPAICGTICAHHCEEECRRNDVDEPLSIRGLKRFAVEHGQAGPAPPDVPAGAMGKVAVVGSGPSGLTAAYDLARRGCAVTVFEKEDQAGGAVRHYIPSYRLPDNIIDGDIREITAQGVEIKYGRELGRDYTLEKLEQEGYQAVLLAMGLPVSKSLNLPGIEGEGILYALPFLQSVKREDFQFKDSPDVIVIGGGNVAMDVARSALRCGAGSVKIVCLESAEEMPAFPWEIEEAREEGVEFNCSCGPGAVLREGGKIRGLETVECTCVFDKEGFFDPSFNKECKGRVDGDIVILAIGQSGDPEPLCGEIDLDEKGRIIFNSNTLSTSRQGVFACGEVVTGPGSAVEAMAGGRQAAQAILHYLEGKSFDSAELVADPVLEKLDPAVAAELARVPRNPIPMINPAERKKHFEQAELGFDPVKAIKEACRCLTCAAGAVRIEELCVNCLTCVRICPYDVPVVNEEGVVSIRNEQCQACGLCLSICPAYAIDFRSDFVDTSVSAIEPAVKELKSRVNGEPAILVLSCAYGSFALPGVKDFEADNAVVVRFPCLAKLDTLHLLKAIELGVDGIVVLGCKEGDNFDCLYKETGPWIQRRLHHARRLLGEIGLGEERIFFSELAEMERGNLEEVLAEASTQFKAAGLSPLR